MPKDDFEITPEEAERIQKCMKDPKFLELFTEYANEISDPKNREEYNLYISQLEAENGIPTGTEICIPDPGYSIKTKDNEGKKTFVNICKSPKIDEGKPQPAVGPDGKKGVSWSIPYSMAPAVRMHADKAGANAKVYDIVFNDKTYAQAQSQPALNQLLVDTAFEAIETKHNDPLDKAGMTILQKKKFFGGPPGAQTLRTSGDAPLPQAPVSAASSPATPPARSKPSQADAPTPKAVKELQKMAKPMPHRPKHTIVHRNKFQLEQTLQVREDTRKRRPDELVVTIQLPLLKSAKDIDLDITETSLTLEAPIPEKENDKYALDLKLPFEVVESEGTAKFDKKGKQLVLTLPVVQGKVDNPLIREIPPEDESQDVKELEEKKRKEEEEKERKELEEKKRKELKEKKRKEEEEKQRKELEEKKRKEEEEKKRKEEEEKKRKELEEKKRKEEEEKKRKELEEKKRKEEEEKKKRADSKKTTKEDKQIEAKRKALEEKKRELDAQRAEVEELLRTKQAAEKAVEETRRLVEAAEKAKHEAGDEVDRAQTYVKETIGRAAPGLVDDDKESKAVDDEVDADEGSAGKKKKKNRNKKKKNKATAQGSNNTSGGGPNNEEEEGSEQLTIDTTRSKASTQFASPVARLEAPQDAVLLKLNAGKGGQVVFKNSTEETATLRFSINGVNKNTLEKSIGENHIDLCFATMAPRKKYFFSTTTRDAIVPEGVRVDVGQKNIIVTIKKQSPGNWTSLAPSQPGSPAGKGKKTPSPSMKPKSPKSPSVSEAGKPNPDNSLKEDGNAVTEKKSSNAGAAMKAAVEKMVIQSRWVLDIDE